MKYLIVSGMLLVWLASATSGVKAAIVDSTQAGFTLRYEKTMPLNARYLYDSFCKEIDKWWDPEHTYSGKAENLYIQNYVGGCFGEHWENGGGTRHMNVIYIDPGKMIRLEGGLGPLQQYAVHAIMTMEIKDDAGKSKVTLTYSVGGYVPGGASKFAPLVDQVLGQMFKRYTAYVEKK